MTFKTSNSIAPSTTPFTIDIMPNEDNDVESIYGIMGKSKNEGNYIDLGEKIRISFCGVRKKIIFLKEYSPPDREHSMKKNSLPKEGWV